MGKARIGVVVGISVNKSAVKRNFWKRQGKAALVPLLQTGNDFILTFFPKITTLSRNQFGKEIKKAIKAIEA